MILALDFGGTFVKYGLVSTDYKIIELSKNDSPKESFDQFIKLIKEKYDHFSKKYEIKGIAIALPTPINEHGEAVGVGGLPYLKGHNVSKELKDVFPVPIIHDNDANASLYGELTNYENVNSAASIVLGTGIGGSIMYGGKVIHGFNGYAGEFGMVSITKENREFFCYSSFSTIELVKRINSKLKKTLTGEEIFEMYDENIIINNEINYFFKAHAEFINTIEKILNPEIIFISGGVTSNKIFKSKLLENYESVKRRYNQGSFKTKIVFSDLKNPNLIGMAYSWFKNN